MATTAGDRVFVDTNVLLAASDPGRPHHRQALHVLDRWPAEGVMLFASGQVLREYLVVATRPLHANGLGLSRAEVLDNVRQLSTRMHMLDEEGRTREHLMALVRDVDVSGKLIHDANIVATMLAGGVTSLLTLDSQGFGRFGHLITLAGLPDA